MLFFVLYNIFIFIVKICFIGDNEIRRKVGEIIWRGVKVMRGMWIFNGIF